MKHLIYLLIFSLLISSCFKQSENNKKENNEINKIEKQNIDKEFVVIIDNINENYFESKNIIYEKNSEYTINEILEYIFSDLNIKYIYNNTDDLLLSLNTKSDFNIKEIISDINSNMYFIIEWDEIKLSYLTSEYIDYYLFDNIEIELDEYNYLNIFPYLEIEAYINDEVFGTSYFEKDSLYYFIYKNEEEFNYGIYDYSCILKFYNGILKSITIDPYRT